MARFEKILVNPSVTTPIDFTNGSNCVLCQMHSKGPCAKFILDVIDSIKSGSSQQPEQMRKFAYLLNCQRANPKFYNYYIKILPTAKVFT